VLGARPLAPSTLNIPLNLKTKSKAGFTKSVMASIARVIASDRRERGNDGTHTEPRQLPEAKLMKLKL
jgi:hypothetical protein